MEMNVKQRTIGVNFTENGSAYVVVWSPVAEKIELCFSNKKIPLSRCDLGYWRPVTPELRSGERYRFLLNGEKELPDPASLSQPDGVHGPSAATSLRDFAWTDHNWKNFPLNEYIFYELHT